MGRLSKSVALGLAVAATFTGCAAAATLGISSASVAAGNAPVASCGVSSLSATRNVDNAGNVTRVDIVGIPATCSGDTLSITLVGSGNASLGGATATVGNCGTTCSVSLTSFGATISAAALTGYSFGVTG